MTIIDDVSTNDMNFKHLDTAKDIVITPRNEFGGQVLLNTAHTWTAKVSDGNNYVGDYPVTLESNSIVVNSADFTNLPAGYYHLEIWEEWIDSNSKKQRSIYPSPQRTIDFTIYQNVTDLAEKEIKTIGFQDVVDQAVMNIGMNYVFKVNAIEPDQTATVVQAAADGKNYVTFNIPRGYKGDTGATGPQGPQGEKGDKGDRGDKGDTGSIDNAGLTNAPAFQALQTQVNDSAVGINLLQGTSATENEGPDDFSEIPVTVGDSYTFSGSMSSPSTSGVISPYIYFFDSSGTMLGRLNKDSNVPVASGTSFAITGVAPTNAVKARVMLVKSDSSITINHRALKFEHGLQATPWSPNPSEILTQSDYAEIKAAIVALGGSLS